MAEGTSDMVEVPSEHDSGCDLDDNLYTVKIEGLD